MQTFAKRILTTILVALAHYGFASCVHRPDLEGLYAFKLKVNGKDFIDLVNFGPICKSDGKRATLEGNLTVPERFSTKILDGHVALGSSPDGTEQSQTFSLAIDTVEKGKALRARYTFVDTKNRVTAKHTCTGGVTFEGEPTPVPLTCFRYAPAPEYTVDDRR